MKMLIIFLIALLTFLGSSSSHALTPIESLILGDISSQYTEKESDPLSYLFRPDASLGDQNKEFRTQLGIYLGFVNEGKNLDNLCKERPQLQFKTPWGKEQLKRSMVATLQYVGLDLTVRAIGKYAKFLEFSPTEFDNLTDKLVGNYCSKNLSLISHRELRRNLKMKFENGDFILPTTKDNPLFPEKLGSFTKVDEAIEQEFLQTVKLFRAFCSWGGDTKDLRLLVPFLRNPVIMSFVARQMGGKTLVWNDKNQTISLARSPDTPKVLCENMICRKRSNEYFSRNISLPLGSEGVEKDVSRLFCTDLRDADYSKLQPKGVKAWVDSKTFDDDNLQIAQLIALLTGVPDFFVRAKEFSDGQDFLRMGVEKSFTEWAQEKAQNFSKDIYYEEALSVDKVPGEPVVKDGKPFFKIVFDVNMGEMDKTNQKVGKITLSFNLNIPKAILIRARHDWLNADPGRYKELRDDIVAKLKKYIGDDVDVERKKFVIPPWKGDIETLMMRELMEQLASYRGTYFQEHDTSLVTVPVFFNYAPFALRYITNEFMVKREKERAKALKSIDEKLETERRKREEEQKKQRSNIDE